MGSKPCQALSAEFLDFWTKMNTQWMAASVADETPMVVTSRQMRRHCFICCGTLFIPGQAMCGLDNGSKDCYDARDEVETLLVSCWHGD